MDGTGGTPINSIRQQPYVYKTQDIPSITDDITDTLDGLTISTQPQEQPLTPKQIKQVQQIQSQQIQHSQQNNEKIMHKIPEIFREPIIIVLIYLFLSLDVVKQTLSTYIPQIKNSSDGSTFFLGYLIYGILLAILIILTKKLLL